MRRASLAVLIAITLVLSWVTTATAATPSQFAISATQVSGGIRVTGVLVDARSRAIGGRSVTVTAAGLGQRSVRTDHNGRISAAIAIPSSTPTTTIQVTGRFGGDKKYSPSSSATAVRWQGSSTTKAPTTKAPTTKTTTKPLTTAAPTTAASTAPPANADMALNASLVDVTVRQGGVLIANGQLLANGAPVADATVEMVVPGDDGGFAVLTNARGEFTAYGQVPSIAPPGGFKVWVVFGGAPGLPRVEKQLPFTVLKALVSSPSPSPAPTPSATPTPSSEIAAGPSAPEMTPTPSQTPPPGPAITVEPRKFTVLALGALGLVLVLGLATSLAHLARAHLGAGDDSPTDHLID